MKNKKQKGQPKSPFFNITLATPNEYSRDKNFLVQDASSKTVQRVRQDDATL